MATLDDLHNKINKVFELLEAKGKNKVAVEKLRVLNKTFTDLIEKIDDKISRDSSIMDGNVEKLWLIYIKVFGSVMKYSLKNNIIKEQDELNPSEILEVNNSIQYLRKRLDTYGTEKIENVENNPDYISNLETELRNQLNFLNN